MWNPGILHGYSKLPYIYFIHISSFFSCISDIFPSDLDFETNLSAAAFPAGKNVACLKNRFRFDRSSFPAAGSQARRSPTTPTPTTPSAREKQVHWKNDFWITSSWKFRKYKVGIFTQIFTTQPVKLWSRVCVSVCVCWQPRTSSHQGNPWKKNRANSSFSSELGMCFPKSAWSSSLFGVREAKFKRLSWRNTAGLWILICTWNPKQP